MARACSRMSSEPMKMASRYIHLDCTFIHTSITSEMLDISRSHFCVSSRNGATKRDESSGELRALNRLVSVGWDLVGRVPDRPKLRRFLLRGHLAE